MHTAADDDEDTPLSPEEDAALTILLAPTSAPAQSE
jgi:hypothetical protein